MKKKSNSAPRFKPSHQHQVELLPQSLDELIPSDHIVRLVDKTIDQMNIDKIFATYKGGGTTSYHPRMMLKVIIYSYIQRTYTEELQSRQ
ncbi:transposase [bacterium]|nr:transposase [bacterium]